MDPSVDIRIPYHELFFSVFLLLILEQYWKFTTDESWLSDPFIMIVLSPTIDDFKDVLYMCFYFQETGVCKDNNHILNSLSCYSKDSKQNYPLFEDS